jgi:SAM-dependent methyltransferase
MSIRNQARGVVVDRLQRVLPDVAPEMQLLGQYFPHAYRRESFSRPVASGAIAAPSGSDLPVPPPDLWAYYCTSAQSWLESGRKDVDAMRGILSESGAPVESARRVLEVGSATGRMIRWLEDVTRKDVEVWGVDIWSTAVLWCHDHLTPPFRFATTTMIPHLPFPEEHFDLLYCGSVFTHIDDLAEAWFLEMHRVLAPGGRLYFSINDRNAVGIFEGKGEPGDYPEFYERTGGEKAWHDFVTMIEANDDYQRFRRGEAYMVSMGSASMKHVMWDADELVRRLAWGWRAHAITPRSYGHQTTVLLERVGAS